MWQDAFVALIVLAALGYAAWQLSRPWRVRGRAGACGSCGDCDGCASPVPPTAPPSAKVARE
jgi:hypothetical protein